jgi:hypothetical protein
MGNMMMMSKSCYLINQQSSGKAAAYNRGARKDTLAQWPWPTHQAAEVLSCSLLQVAAATHI